MRRIVFNLNTNAVFDRGDSDLDWARGVQPGICEQFTDDLFRGI